MSSIHNFALEDAFLDFADIPVIEEGQRGMRQLTNDEKNLLTRSQEKQWELQRLANYHDASVTVRLQKLGYYDRNRNPVGSGINHQYNALERNGERLVFDAVSGLTWQQSGSENTMTYDDAEKYIRALNTHHYAGHNDWRMPTLWEAMSLMKPAELEEEAKMEFRNPFIDLTFDKTKEFRLYVERCG